MARPSTRSIHGTANHGDDTDPNRQVEFARNGYSQGGPGIKGACRTKFVNIFDIDSNEGRGTGDDINEIAYALMSNGTAVVRNIPFNTNVLEGHSLDFPQGFTSGKFDFDAGDNKLDTTTLDNAYIWGPNIRVPAELLNDPNTPVDPLPADVDELTKASDDKNLPAGEALFDTNGYGVSNVNNDPRRNHAGLNILEQRASTNAGVQSKLGEYLNTNTYEYEE